MRKWVCSGMRQISLQYPLLNMLMSAEGSSAYGPLVERISLLLSRENLCSSLYLARFISNSLTLPLHALAEERTVAQLTADRALIRRAVQESRLANLVSEDSVQLIAYPTIKLPPASQFIFKELETVLSQLQKHHSFSRRNDDDSINLTLYDEDPTFLQQLMTSLSQEVAYDQANLYDDIRTGTAAARKNKNNHYHKKQYSLERPPQIFIRRAVDSEDEEPEKERRGREGKEGREAREGRRKYREVVREAPAAKPMFNNDDFPLLS